jgi:V8-like Glu-specific endopeptidase
MEKLAILFLLLPLLLSSCGKKEGKVYSDAPQVEALTDPNAYPSVVMVVLPGGQGMCTGTFISPRAVLTAAHCTQATGRYSVISAFGTFSTNTRENLSTGQLEDPSDLSILVLGSDVARRSRGQVAYMGSEAHSGEKVRLVGFGCNNLDTRAGGGIKRAGTNHISSVNDYLNLQTPFTSAGRAVLNRPILGPKEQAGSCYGDSGGPMFRSDNYENAVVGITHAGGSTSTYIVSQYLNTGRNDIQNFIHAVNTNYNLGIYDYCNPADSIGGSACGQSANMSIADFIEELFLSVYNWVKALFS